MINYKYEATRNMYVMRVGHLLDKLVYFLPTSTKVTKCTYTGDIKYKIGNSRRMREGVFVGKKLKRKKLTYTIFVNTAYEHSEVSCDEYVVVEVVPEYFASRKGLE